MSVTAENTPVLVPPDFASATVAPPELSALPAASFVVTVTVTLLPEVTVPEETVMSDVVADAPPGVTVMVGIEVVMVAAAIVPENVFDVPASVPVKVAV